MHDDEVMDRLLQEAMAADVPQLSPRFEAAVRERVRPRRLSRGGRILLLAYGLAAAAATMWLLTGVPPLTIAIGVSAGMATALGAGAYVRRLVMPH